MIKDLWVKYKSIIAYLFWGVVTTVVNLAVFQLLSPGLHWNVALATVIAWFASVLVAYFTNKVWVFGSYYTTVSDFIVEIFRFFFYRIFLTAPHKRPFPSALFRQRGHRRPRHRRQT